MEYLIERRYKGKTYRYFCSKKEYLVGGQWKQTPKGLRKVALPDDEGQAIAMAKQLKKELDAWRMGDDEMNLPTAAGSFAWLVGEYKKSLWFKELGERTQKEYGYILEAIKEQLRKRGIADAPASEYTRQHARLIYAAFAEKPRKAQLVAAIARIVFNFGIEMGHLPERNPFEKMDIRKTKPRQVVWLDIEALNMFWRIDAIKDTAIKMGLPSIAFAMDLALYSAQRESDLLSMAWNKYDGDTITLRQKKTGAWVRVTMDFPGFKAELDARNRDKKSPIMLISERTGQPYTKDHFGDVFREVRAAAGIDSGFKFMDMRRTSVVLYAVAGSKTPEIKSISGHTDNEVSDIIETYLPPNSLLAKHAAEKLKAYLSGLKLQKKPDKVGNSVEKNSEKTN